MPVKDVELVERQEIEVLEDELLRHEVAANIEVAPTPAEARTIFDLDTRDRPRRTGDRGAPEDLGRQQLPHGLRAMKDAGRFVCADRDLVSTREEAIALVAEAGERRVEGEGDARLCRGRIERQRKAGRGAKLVAQELRLGTDVVAGDDRRRQAQNKRARARRELRGNRNQRVAATTAS